MNDMDSFESLDELTERFDRRDPPRVAPDQPRPNGRQQMSDSRVEKYATYLRGVSMPNTARTRAQCHLNDMEYAGLVVLDPDDPAGLELIARALWNGTDAFLPMASAAKVIAALRSPS